MLADKAADKQAAALKKVHKALTDGGVIGDVLPELWLPLITIDGKFPAGKKVVPGKEIPLAATLSLPTLSLSPLPNPTAYHTVLITDPDVPSRADPSLGERRYLCVSNIPGEALATGDLTKGEWLQDWEAPTPESGSGLHRFVVVVYEQPGSEKIEMSVFEKSRDQFGSYKWAEGFGMRAIGANFWQAQEK
ncbi:hypothetical protein HK097_008156 [Rhizophlyctis rosea]|uniref:PEBP-like protein n=1 Tax=Rhizophlyctis rosea TaxID=64517 RepID=A0AAD5SCP9_9FUNG|nr:hypothetical protein HK097_008156 [Rhizophlyctis rosea]